MSKTLLVIGATYNVRGMDGDVFELTQVVEKDSKWDGITTTQAFAKRADTGRTWVFNPGVLTMTEESRLRLLEQLGSRG